MSSSSQYHQLDYEFANTFVTLRTTIGLTQQGLARQLGISSKAVANWEQGLSRPKAEHLKAFLTLCIRHSAFAAGHEEEQIRACWKAARQKVLLDEHWLQKLLAQFALSLANGTGGPSADSGQNHVAATKVLALWTVPYARNPHFTGRNELLAQLERQFAPRTDQPATLYHAALTQAQAIKGLGGIGKTQAAIEYAYRAREQGRYAHILWISAASEDAILASFATLKERVPALEREEESDQRALVKAVLRWLEQCPESWLLIYDNADDMPVLSTYLPIEGQGNILFTTRASAVGALAPALEVGALSLEEGVRLLLRRAGREADVTEQEREEASAIVLELERFPLAIDQAGAYLEETGCGLADYLQTYQQHQYQLLARRGRQVSGYPDSVATTWSLAFERIEKRDPAAAELLLLCAFVAPDSLPEELLTEGAAFWPATLQEATADRLRFNQMLAALLDFSLIKRVGREQMLTLHRLVQAVQRERMTREEQRQWAERFVLAVHAVFPPNSHEFATWSACQRSLEQALACARLIEQHDLRRPEAAALLHRTGNYLHKRALYALAEPFLLQGLAMREQILGEAHPDVATSLQKLAILYTDQGQYARAEPYFQQALRVREQLLGPEHLEVARANHNLAALYVLQGQYVRAEPYFQRALRICEQHLGPEHPLVANALDSLGELFRAQGRYAEAEPLFQRALRIYEQNLGPEHLDVATPTNNLGELYREQGQYAEAEPLFQRALRIWEQVLGPEHPLVAHPLTNLADLSREQGHYAQAKLLYQRALSIREQVLGPEHPLVAAVLHGQAELAREQGQSEQAELLYERALRIYEPHLPEHPFVATILAAQARLAVQQGRESAAEAWLQRALAIRETIFGPEHPQTVEICEQIQALLIVMGRTQEAPPMEE